MTRREKYEYTITEGHYRKRKAILEKRIRDLEEESYRVQRRIEKATGDLYEVEHKWELEVWYRGLSEEEKAM